MEIFQKDLIKFREKVTNWEEGLLVASEPLLKHGYIDKNFTKILIEETKKLGPWYIIAPNLAMGHISPDNSIKKNGISLLYLDEPVVFKDENNPIKFLFILSAKDSDSHIHLLKELSLAFSNSQFYKEFYHVKNFEDIVKLEIKYLK